MRVCVCVRVRACVCRTCVWKKSPFEPHPRTPKDESGHQRDILETMKVSKDDDFVVRRRIGVEARR